MSPSGERHTKLQGPCTNCLIPSPPTSYANSPCVSEKFATVNPERYFRASPASRYSHQGGKHGQDRKRTGGACRPDLFEQPGSQPGPGHRHAELRPALPRVRYRDSLCAQAPAPAAQGIRSGLNRSPKGEFVSTPGPSGTGMFPFGRRSGGGDNQGNPL